MIKLQIEIYEKGKSVFISMKRDRNTETTDKEEITFIAFYEANREKFGPPIQSGSIKVEEN